VSTKSAAVLANIRSRPHWRVLFHPAIYERERIGDPTELVQLVERNAVRLRGWDFPTIDRNGETQERGESWVAGWCEYAGHIEYWRLYQSGQFVFRGSVVESANLEWRERLRGDTIAHLKHLGRNAEIDSAPGFLSQTNMIYTITEYFEFAARLCAAGVFAGGLSGSVELHNVEGLILTTDWNKALTDLYRYGEPSMACPVNANPVDVIGAHDDMAVDASLWVSQRFGRSLSKPSIKAEQRAFREGRY
jgi:hypothetical protein